MPLNREDERRIIKSIQKAASDLDSLWVQLKDEYDKSVYQCARSATRTDADAREVADQTWAKFWKGLNTFDPDRSLIMTFLRGIVVHSAADMYPPGKPRLVPINDPGDEGRRAVAVAANLPDLGESPEERLIRKEALEARRKQYALMLKLAFNLDSPPHLKIAFGFLRLLELKSGQIVTRWSPETLDLAGETLEKDYAKEGRVQLKDVEAAFEGLRKGLNAAIRWEHVDENRAGSTVLESYYTVKMFDDKKQKIQGWADTVRRKLVVRLAIFLPEERIDGGEEQ